LNLLAFVGTIGHQRVARVREKIRFEDRILVARKAGTVGGILAAAPACGDGAGKAQLLLPSRL
jgi:hypothetical protein